MKKLVPTITFRISLILIFYGFYSSTYGQATVFTDNFTTSTGASYTTATGPIGTSPTWNLTRSGVDFGAAITSGLLYLTDDASSAGNNNGWALASTNTNSFITPYNTSLNSNPGMVTWTFNMRQQQSNPSGFASGNYGAAFILAGTSGTTNSSGTGYAVTLGNSGKTDPLKLVSYSAGLQSTTQVLASTTTGLTDFGNTYLSVKVTYTPSTNTWQMYVRNDGTTFIDPNSGSLTSQGTAVNSTYTSTALPIMGAFWNASTRSSQRALYDNVKVTVVVPTTTSISPPSKVAGTGAFTLTVNGTGFVSGTSVVRWNGSNRTTTFVSATQLTAAILSTDITSSGTATVTVANGAAVSNGQPFSIDLAGVPNISLSTSALTTMTTVTGTASSAQTYTVSASNLTADVTVTAPTNFEVSPNGTTYSSSITLTRTGNVLVGQPVTVYARVKATAPSGLYSATIDHTTAGGTTKSIAVSATVIASKPTTQATAVTFTTVTSTTFTVNWTNGNGANHLVLIRSGGAVNSNPVDGVIYTAINSFGAGSEIGTGNYVIYSGSSNTVNITGLQPNTAYYVAVYDYNGSGGTESYLTTSPAAGNRTTLNAPVGWQIYNTNTTNTITFDTTVDGVNEGTYQAAGLSPTLTSGELNSNAWAISGFSDGAIAFGGASTDGQDFDRGIEYGGVSIGGLYAFDTATNNFALGIQPATGDFVPGSATLRFQNQTGAAVTSVSIGYKVYVYNDQAASSSFNFSHSVDNSTYTSVSGLNVTSPATADGSPTWKSYYRVVTLTGLNVANNAYYFFRWTGATVSGSTDFDEFGLDDIVMVANPSTNFASFNGTAENFAVLGNTTLSGTTTVASDLSINGGKVDINGNTLTLNGTVTNTTTGGLKGSASSNLIISGAVSPSLSFDQTTLGTTNLLNNLSINTTASNTVTISNPVVVNGTLTTALGQTLNMGTNALTGTLTTIANNGTIATQNTTSLPIPSGKTWSGTGTVNYNAAATAQTIVVATYQNLTSSSTGGATAAGSFTVNGILNLPTANPSATIGSLTMGTYTLTMGGNATNLGIGDVTGTVTRNSIMASTLYTFGNTYTSIIFPNIGTLPTSMSLKIAIGTAPAWRAGAINRTYDFIQTGASGTKAVIKARYLDSELNGNIETKLVDWAYIVSSSTTLEQGRSNYNTTENWVELTNVNVALYFTGTFGQVLLTLDESAAGSLTWNGSVSNSWTTATNWTPNATPSDLTVVYIPDAATTPNDPTLNPSVLLGSLNIEAGGIVNAPDNSQFTVNNGAGAWINNGIYNPGAGTSAVIFTGTDATIAGSTNFNNITINSGAGLRPLTDNIMQIAGAFTLNGSFSSGMIENTVIYSGTNQTVVNPNTGLQAYHNLIINGTGAIFPTSLNITDDLTLNQAVDFTGKTIVMTGMEPQHIFGTVTPAFNNLTINNTLGGVSLATNSAVNGTLTLTSGNLNIANYNLLLGANAVSGSFSATNMIVASGTGEVRRTYTGTGSYTFPIGDITDTVEYSPITVNLTAGTFSSAYLGVAVVDGIHPNNSSAANNITRYWKVKESGITGAVATITANYLAADITGTEGDISGGQLNGTFNQATNPWIKYTALASNSFTATGATLTAGQTSAFTGIKGGTFSATIFGYGSYCLNDIVTLTATPTNGDAPYTYSWNGGLGTQAIVSPPTASAGTVNYAVTIKDSNGITATDNANVLVSPTSVGGTVYSNETICSGSSPSDVTLLGNTGNVIKWESASDAAFTTPTTITSTATTLTSALMGALTSTTYFRAIVQSGACSTANSAYVTITVNPILTASVSISATATTICAGSSVTFTATPTNGGSTPTYQWKINGSNVSGQTAATFTTTTLSNSDAVTVAMTSNATCVAPSPATSNSITETVNSYLPASVSIATSATTICAGSSATFTATPTNGGTTPTYQWKINGSNVSGQTAVTFTTTTLANTDAVTVVMTSNATCVTGSPATSNSISMTVNPNLPASVSIAITSGSQTICVGTSVTFTATPTNGGTTPTYQWKNSGVDISGATSTTYTSTTLANNNAITVVMASNASPCLTGSPAASNGITMTVNPNLPASVSISATATTICAGSTVTFTATPTNGGTPSYQWKLNGGNVGTNSATYSNNTLANGNTVTVVMTSTATCATGSPATSNTVTMTVNPNLPASVAIAATPSSTICSGTNVTFTATPTNGGTPSYQWKLNGGNVGTNSATYSNAALANGDLVTVVMISTATCASGSPATSNTVTMTVNPNLPASVAIAATPSSTICSGTSVTFTATPTNGGTPSYQWKLNGGNVGANSATYSNSTLANGDLVTVVITSTATCATGSPTTSNSVTMSVISTNTTAAPSSSPTLCINTAISPNITIATTGATGIGSPTGLPAGVTAAWFGNVITISGTPTTAVGSPFNYTIPLTGGCGSINATGTITISNTTWTGAANTTSWSTAGNWTCGVPVALSNVTIASTGGTYPYPVIGSNVTINSLTMNSGTTLKVDPLYDLTVTDAIVNNGTLTIENSGNLIQVNNVANSGSGATKVKRDSNPLIRLDYTMWSSPVTGQGLYAFSKYTFPNRFYKYIPTFTSPATTGAFNNSLGFTMSNLDVNGVNGIDTSNVPFAAGIGYLIRMPWNHPTAATIWHGEFTGTPNNGTINVSITDAGDRFNLVGNPYPSPINISSLVSTYNSGNIQSTLYFWRKTNNAASPSYCSWNAATNTFGDNNEAYTNSPLGVIQTGQGFFVEAKTGATNLVFRNEERIGDNANQFFRSSETTATSPTTLEANRIWLNMTGATSGFSQSVVGYFTNSELGVDDTDSKFFNDGPIAFTSTIANKDYVIQGRPTPFDASDVVAMKYKVTAAGNYTITIDHVDGLFSGASQVIYLRDNVTGTIHNLNNGAYTFTSDAGAFDTRFEILYQMPLHVDTSIFNANQVVIYKNEVNDFVINSGNVLMASVRIFDIRGRLLIEKKGINASQTTMNVGAANEVLLVQVTSVEGEMVTKKVVR